MTCIYMHVYVCWFISIRRHLGYAQPGARTLGLDCADTGSGIIVVEAGCCNTRQPRRRRSTGEVHLDSTHCTTGVACRYGAGLRQLQVVCPKRFMLSVDNDNEFRSRYEIVKIYVFVELNLQFSYKIEDHLGAGKTPSLEVCLSRDECLKSSRSGAGPP